jgi:glycosyltransferase involved in cell wall biosynthesis
MHKILSILIISLPERCDKLAELFGQLTEQTNGRSDVELLVLTDNRSMSVGKKRQFLNMMASGDYVIHVDDDDCVHPKFVEKITEAIATNPGVDVINFVVEVTIDGGAPKPCVYSHNFQQNMNFDSHYQRLPNTRCCFRRSVALREEIPDMVFGEDDEWGKRIVPHVQQEYCIPEVLYYYHANTRKPSEWFSQA